MGLYPPTKPPKIKLYFRIETWRLEENYIPNVAVLIEQAKRGNELADALMEIPRSRLDQRSYEALKAYMGTVPQGDAREAELRRELKQKRQAITK